MSKRVTGSLLKRVSTSILALICFALIVFSLPTRVFAQDQEPGAAQEGESSSRNHDAVENQDSKVDDASGGAPAIAPVSIDNPPTVQRVGFASPLGKERGPIQWGRFYVSTVSLIYELADGLRIDPVNLSSERVINQAGVFSTGLVYDRMFRRSRVALQYEPSLAFVNGRMINDFSSHQFGFSTYYFFSRRWSMELHDSYTRRSSRLLYGNYFLDVDYISGRAQQGSFLNNGAYTDNETHAIFNYQLNARDQFSIAPKFQFQSSPLDGTLTNSNTYGTSLTWNHAASRSRSYGLYYTLERRTFTQLLPNTFYQSFGMNYSQRLGRTWSLASSLGLGTASDAGGRQYTFTGSLALTKTFRRSGAAIAYYRGNTMGPFLTNRYVDRMDMSYSMQLSKGWSAGVSVGHQRAGTEFDQNSGTYMTVLTRHRFTHRVSWTMNFGRRWQGGVPSSSPLTDTSRAYFFSTGLLWDLQQRQPY